MRKEFTKPKKDRENVKLQQDINLTFKQRRHWLKQALSIQELFENFKIYIHIIKVLSLSISYIQIDDIIYLFNWLL